MLHVTSRHIPRVCSQFYTGHSPHAPSKSTHLSHTHAHTYTHTQSLSLSFIHTHTHTHTLFSFTHTHTLFSLSHTPSTSLVLEVCSWRTLRVRTLFWEEAEAVAASLASLLRCLTMGLMVCLFLLLLELQESWLGSARAPLSHTTLSPL